MSINIQFYGPINTNNQRYMSLSDKDRKFLCPDDLLSGCCLPQLMLCAGIGVVTKNSVHHIVERIHLLEGRAFVASLSEWCGVPLEVYLERFIGTTSNIPTETSTEFAKRLRAHFPRLTAGEARALHQEANRILNEAANAASAA